MTTGCACVCHEVSAAADRIRAMTNFGHKAGECWCICTCPRSARGVRLTSQQCPIHTTTGRTS